MSDTATIPLARWQAAHAERRARPDQLVCGDRSSLLRPDVPCDLPAGHDGPHESEFGFWNLQAAGWPDSAPEPEEEDH